MYRNTHTTSRGHLTLKYYKITLVFWYSVVHCDVFHLRLEHNHQILLFQATHIAFNMT